MSIGRSARQRLFCLIAGFLLLGALALTPGVGNAQTTPLGDCDSTSTAAATNGSQIALGNLITDLTTPLGSGPMQTKLAGCIGNLEALYAEIASLFTGPFDPLGIVRMLVMTVVNQIVQAILSAVCSYIDDAVNFARTAAENLLTSLVCLPKPPWIGGLPGFPSPPGGYCGGWSPFNGTSTEIGGIAITIPAFTSYRFRQ